MNKNSNNSYSDSIQHVCIGMQLINASTSLTNTQKKVFIDLLDRIKRNCLSLSKLSDIDSNYLTIRLLQRTIIGDLITFFFFTSLVDDDSAFNDALNVLNRQSMMSIEKWLKVHWEIDALNAKKRGEEYISEETYLESYKSYINKNFPTINSKKCKINNVDFTGKPTDMLSCTKDPNLSKAIKYLSTEYRFLSQIEHYCPFNSGFSFVHQGDNTISTHKNVICFQIVYLLDVIKELVNNE